MLRFPTVLPVSRVADPASAPSLGWGILAPGWIARSFVGAIKTHTSQRVVAVGSRSKERSTTFASLFSIDSVHESYEALVEDPAVDVVYVASPHSEHHRHALLAIAAGKHVLVEKAFTQNAVQAREVINAAMAAGVLVQEAMWTRFLPGMDVVRQLLVDGALGELINVTADHGQYFKADAEFRLFNPNLAGGALLDLGIYPLSFASFVLGTPAKITAFGKKAFTGVDGQVSALLESPDGAEALVNTTLFAKTPTTASISGTESRIEIPGDFYAPQPIAVISREGDRLMWDSNSIVGHEALCFQAAEVARLIASGATESPYLTHSETVSILATVDEIRRQIGVILPGDQFGQNRTAKGSFDA